MNVKNPPSLSSSIPLVDRQHGTMLEQLPTETMMHVLECLDVASRMRLPGMNMILQQRVCQECSQEAGLCKIFFVI
jgi:hypothetical protein